MHLQTVGVETGVNLAGSFQRKKVKVSELALGKKTFGAPVSRNLAQLSRVAHRPAQTQLLPLSPAPWWGDPAPGHLFQIKNRKARGRQSLAWWSGLGSCCSRRWRGPARLGRRRPRKVLAHRRTNSASLCKRLVTPIVRRGHDGGATGGLKCQLTMLVPRLDLLYGTSCYSGNAACRPVASPPARQRT